MLTLAMPKTPGAKLSDLRRNHKPTLSQLELSRRLKVTRGVVANYESDRTAIPFDVAKKAADIWETTVEWLYNEEDEGPPPKAGAIGGAPTLNPQSQPGTKRRYAVVGIAGCSVAPMATVEQGLTVAFDDELTGPGNRIVIQARGKSMEPRIADGSFLLIDPLENRREKPYGLLVVARNSEWEYCAKVLRRRNGEDWLDPLNDNFEPILTNHGWELAAVVVAIKHRRGPGKYTEEGDTDGLGPNP